MALVGFWVWSGAGFDYAKEITVVNEPSMTSSASPAPRFTILDKIREGIEMLRQSPPLDYETRYYSIKNGAKPCAENNALSIKKEKKKSIMKLLNY